MKVRIAGFNVDYDALKKCKGTEHLTPETLSAAYARISRSPRPVHELRDQARREVEKARISNKKIIFDMGHHSVAEHAVFNFDIIGISRRAVEELEHYRLCSYTEKSQRYVTLEGDYVVPQELAGTSLYDDFVQTIERQNACYVRLNEKISEYNHTRFRNKTAAPQDRRLHENLAKEDARYILSLATQAQLGMTANARTLELMIRRFASHPMHEIQELGASLFELASRIAPSLLLFCQANPFNRKTYPGIAQTMRRSRNMQFGSYRERDVVLVRHTRNADTEVLAALLFRTTGMPFTACRHHVARMSRTQKNTLFKQACEHAELYDTMLREFEQANLTYQLIVSAGCFGQLKRHRMATLICQQYEPGLGVTIPQSVKNVGEESAFMSIVTATEKVYRAIHRRYPAISSYILTNAHRRRVVMNLSLRELYHMSRLREDPTAQWDIRDKSRKMSALARHAMPICAQLLGGKTEYPRLYKFLYGRLPKVKEVPEP